MYRTLISFLGMNNYKPLKYFFNRHANEMYEESYPSTAIFRKYISNKQQINKMIILGTENSNWYGLIENLISICSNEPIYSTLSDEQKNFVGQTLGTTYSQYASYNKYKKPYTQNDVDSICLSINNTLGTILKCSFNFIIHERQTQTIIDQYSITKVLLNKDLIPENAHIILDITNGLRAMPMLAFITIECIKQLRNIKLEHIFYAKMNFAPAKYINDKSVTDSIIGKLRLLALKQEHFSSDEIKDIINNINSLIPNSPRSNSDSSADVFSITDIDDVTDIGVSIGQFTHTTNFAKLGYFSNKHVKKQYEEITTYLHWGNYIEGYKALTLKNNKKNFIDLAINNDIKTILKNNFRWCNSDDCINSLQRLSALYLSNKSYIQAINALYSSLVLQQCCQSNKLNIDDKNLVKKYDCYVLKSFRDNYRGTIVHLHDSDANKKIFNSINNANANDCLNIFHKQISNIFRKLGVQVINKEQLTEPRSNLFISFIGGGDYETCLYQYKGEDVYDYNKENIPSFVGVSLSSYLSKTIKNGLDTFLIYGTERSNWGVVAESLEATYPCLATITDSLKDLFKKNGLLTQVDINNINTLLDLFHEQLGFTINLALVPEDLNNAANLNTIKSTLSNCKFVKPNTHLYIDTTHSYRMIPIFLYCEACALQLIKNVVIEDIFYGDINDDFINCKHADILETCKRKLMGLRNNLPTDEYIKVTNNISSIIDALFESKGIEPTSIKCGGKINNLQNLINLHKDTIQIGQYAETGNLDCLLPIISKEFKSNLTDKSSNSTNLIDSANSKENSSNSINSSAISDSSTNSEISIINQFKLGVFYSNVSQISTATPYLQNVYKMLKTYENSKSPIFKLIQPTIIEKLSWLNQKNTYSIYVEIGLNYLDRDLIKSLLYVYEGLKKFSKEYYRDKIKLLLKKIIMNNGNTNIDFNDNNRLNNSDVIIRYTIQYYLQSINKDCLKKHLCPQDISSSSKINLNVDDINNSIDSFVLNKIFREWGKIRTIRQNMFHGKIKISEIDTLNTTIKSLCNSFLNNEHKFMPK